MTQQQIDPTLEQREQAVAALEQQLSEGKARLSTRSQQLDNRSANLDQREQSLQQREDGLNNRSTALQQQQEALQQKEATIAARELAVKEKEEAINAIDLLPNDLKNAVQVGAITLDEARAKLRDVVLPTPVKPSKFSWLRNFSPWQIVRWVGVIIIVWAIVGSCAFVRQYAPAPMLPVPNTSLQVEPLRPAKPAAQPTATFVPGDCTTEEALAETLNRANAYGGLIHHSWRTDPNTGVEVVFTAQMIKDRKIGKGLDKMIGEVKANSKICK